MGDPRSFPADPAGYDTLLADTRRRAAAQPADRHARTGSRTPGAERDRPVRARLRLAAPLSRTTTFLRPSSSPSCACQATLAVEHGFDGVMTSEHHGGFAGLPPQPAPGGGLVPRRHAAGLGRALPAAASRCGPRRSSPRRSPGSRRGSPAGSASGSPPARCPPTSRSWTCTMERPRGPVRRPGSNVSSASCTAARPTRSPATRRSRRVPRRRFRSSSAAMGFTAVRRAARLGVGMLFDSLSTPPRCRELTDAYRDAGGPGPCILIRRAWLGELPAVRSRNSSTGTGATRPAARRPTGVTTSSRERPTPTRSPTGCSTRCTAPAPTR